MKRDRFEDEARGLWAEGLSHREIGEEMGIPKATISRWLKGLGPRPERDRDREVNRVRPIAKQILEAIESEAVEACVTTDPEGILSDHLETLDNHKAIARNIQGAVQVMEHRADRVNATINIFARIPAEKLESAVVAPIMVKLATEGTTEIAYEPPDEWTQVKRRISLAQQLVNLERSRVALAADQARLVANAIRLERQAIGIDYVQELGVSLARVMSAGYHVSS